MYKVGHRDFGTTVRAESARHGSRTLRERATEVVLFAEFRQEVVKPRTFRPLGELAT